MAVEESRPIGQTEGQEGTHRQWDQEQGSWEECRDTAQFCRDGVRKTKVRLELNLTRTQGIMRKASIGVSEKPW